MRVVAVTVNWNRAELTRKAVLSIRNSVAAVVVVDNGSSDKERAEIMELSRLSSNVVALWMGSNAGYAAGANRGILRALEMAAEGVLLVNNDVEAAPQAVERLVDRLASEPAIGMVMPTVVDSAGGLVLHTECGLDLRTGRPSWVDHGVPIERVSATPRATGYVSGEAFLARADVLRAVRGFDERYSMYFEDADLSVRVRRAGWRLEVVPSAVFSHAVGGSGAAARGVFFRARNRTLFLRWALGQGRLSAACFGGHAAAELAARLAIRGRPLSAAAAAAGWAAGVARLVEGRVDR